jgi:hypothetical protein
VVSHNNVEKLLSDLETVHLSDPTKFNQNWVEIIPVRFHGQALFCMSTHRDCLPSFLQKKKLSCGQI